MNDSSASDTEISPPQPDYRSAFCGSYLESQIGLTGEVTAKSLEEQSKIYKKLFAKFLPRDRKAKILDVGCGCGGFVHFLKRSGYQNSLGIDSSKQQVKQARELGLPEVRFADFSSFLKGRSSEFDLIIALDLIEHLKKNEALEFVRAARQTLHPTGKLLLRTPNGASPFGGRYAHGDLTHEVCYTITSLRQLLAVSGFKKMQFFPVEPIVHGIASGLRFILWKGIALLLRFALLVETGEFRDQIVTQNIIAIAVKD